MRPTLLIVVSVILGATANVLGKKWAEGEGWNYYFACMAVFLLGSTFWVLALRSRPLSSSTLLGACLGLCLAFMCDAAFFKLKFSWQSAAGLVLGLCALVLLEKGRAPD